MKMKAIRIWASLTMIFVGIAMVVVGGVLVARLGFVSKKDLESFTKEYTEQINAISIDYCIGELNIKQGDTLKVAAKDVLKGSVDCKINNGELIVTGKDKKLFHIDNSELTIYIPDNIDLEKLKISTGFGIFNMDDITSSEMIISTGFGESRINNIKADRIDIDGGIGSIKIYNSYLSDLDLNTGIGEAYIDAEISGNCNINGGIGEVTLNTNTKTEDYRFSCSRGLGDIRINHESYKHYEGNNGKYLMRIENGIGVININMD